jgi:hypothetical protein
MQHCRVRAKRLHPCVPTMIVYTPIVCPAAKHETNYYLNQDLRNISSSILPKTISIILEVSQVLLSWITVFLVGKEDKQYELKVPHLSRRM